MLSSRLHPLGEETQIAELWDHFCAFLQEGVKCVNARPDVCELARITATTSEEVRVDLGATIFDGMLDHQKTTKLVFHRSTFLKPDAESWFCLSFDERGQLLIMDQNNRAIRNAEELSRRALAFMSN